MAAHDSGSPRDSLVLKGGLGGGEPVGGGGTDMHDPVVLALASTHEAQRIEVIHARARARARAQDKAADALAAVLEVVYPPGDFSEAVVVLKQYACSVEDRLRMKPPTGDEAKTVIMFVLVHVCMLAEIGVAFTEGFTLEHLLVKDSTRPLSMTNLVLSGYQNMQTVNGAVSVVDAAADHAAGLHMQPPTQVALTRLFQRVEHFSDDLPLPIELDPEADFKTLQSLYAAIARNDG
ncbi:hypothetical protein BCR44DRAFT_37816 [Catenaria anguillulae PL171]|uniref:Uncharacterized protein n=1 Tax=Catenaria anguillulae PL171 TaxID=765915 RepID=A0A1Y2HX92_9FUNG|nr:hypothetical protein BCR44DRAFT_37816 [Catenaria anguillulae PL171]